VADQSGQDPASMSTRPATIEVLARCAASDSGAARRRCGTARSDRCGARL